MPLKSYAEVQAFIAKTLTDLGVDAQFAPHEVFWSTLSYKDFVDGTVPNIPGAVKILVKGNSSQSTIIDALKGVGLFKPGGRFRRMPAGGPFFSDAQIKEIADWIDGGCPEHPPAGVV